jgi:hypothetical protein
VVCITFGIGNVCIVVIVTEALLGKSMDTLLDTPWYKYDCTQCLFIQSYPPTNVRKRGNLVTVLIDGSLFPIIYSKL